MRRLIFLQNWRMSLQEVSRSLRRMARSDASCPACGAEKGAQEIRERDQPEGNPAQPRQAARARPTWRKDRSRHTSTPMQSKALWVNCGAQRQVPSARGKAQTGLREGNVGLWPRASGQTLLHHPPRLQDRLEQENRLRRSVSFWVTLWDAGHQYFPEKLRAAQRSLLDTRFSTLPLLLLSFYPDVRRVNGPASSSPSLTWEPSSPLCHHRQRELGKSDRERGRRGTSADKMILAGSGKGKGRKDATRKESGYFPRFTLMWSASCIVQSSAWSARWMLYRC